jgi:hypothetical protein
MMEAARYSETSFDNYFTRQYISEDSSEHHSRRRENLKSHKLNILSAVFYLCVQTGSGAHPASCTMGTGGPLPGGKARSGVTLTTHPHLVLW